MITGTSKTALSAVRVALLAGVSAASLLCASQADAAECVLQNPAAPSGTSAVNALACGPNARASGSESTAVGGGTAANRPLASGTQSTAVGALATATGDFSTAVGRNTSAAGRSGFAGGDSANAAGEASVAIGGDSPLNTGAQALGISSIAIGGRNDGGAAATARGNGAVAIGGGVGPTPGAQTVAGTNFGVAIGTGSVAGNSAAALGAGARATFNNSVAIGTGAVAGQANEIVLGSAGAAGNQLITMNGVTNFNSPNNNGTTQINGGFVRVLGGSTSNIGGNVNTLTPGNAALNVSGGAVINNGLEVNQGLRVTGPSQGQGFQTIDMGGNRVQDVATPIFGTDAANKAYVDRGLNKAFEGTAIALAISQPIIGPNQTFAIRGGWGTYENQNAFGLSAAGIIGRDWLWNGSTVALDGGVGWGSNNSVAGKAGITVAFGAGYAAAPLPLK